LLVELIEFPGRYEDSTGDEEIVWRASSPLPGRLSRLKLRTEIRGVVFDGGDLDVMDPADPAAACAAGLALDAGGSLTNCVLGGTLPCSLEECGKVVRGEIEFALDLRPGASSNPARPTNLRLATTVLGPRYEAAHEWFEDGIPVLEATLPAGVRFRCCLTCGLSDYSPGGHGLTGILCHRDAREQYLAVRSKLDYWKVPVTEEVLETYLCPQYEPRVPGTGYRG
jgi:hypothetical protein